MHFLKVQFFNKHNDKCQIVWKQDEIKVKKKNYKKQQPHTSNILH